MLEKTLESPFQSMLKGNNPEYSLEGLMLKLQYFGHLMWSLIRKDPDAGQDWRQEKKGTTEDEVVGWHHSLDGHEFEQGPGDGEEQESLVCCSPWGHKESDMADNWTELNSFMKSSIILAVKKNLF